MYLTITNLAPQTVITLTPLRFGQLHPTDMFSIIGVRKYPGFTKRVNGRFMAGITKYNLTTAGDRLTLRFRSGHEDQGFIFVFKGMIGILI